MAEWIYANGALVQFFVQIIFWIGILAVAIVAVVLFNKFIKARIAADEALVAMYGDDDEEHDHEHEHHHHHHHGHHHDEDEAEVEVEKFVD